MAEQAPNWNCQACRKIHSSPDTVLFCSLHKAAPELLKALERISQCGLDTPNPKSALEGCANIARAAISKAKPA